MRRIEKFTDDTELNRRLKELQSAAHERTTEIEDSTDRRLKPTPIATGNVNVKFGDFLRCDPSNGGFTVHLPQATEADAGKRLLVKNVTSSANVILVEPPGDAQIDGTTALGINVAAGSASLQFDGQNWWRE